jgi:hypothetical protein
MQYKLVFVLEDQKEIHFPCNYDGDVYFDQLSRENTKLYYDLINGKIRSLEEFIEDIEMNEIDYAVGECEHCNTKITLTSFLNVCPNCKTEYSIKGEKI